MEDEEGKAGKTMTAFGRHEWLKSAVRGEMETPMLDKSAGEVSEKEFEVNCGAAVALVSKRYTRSSRARENERVSRGRERQRHSRTLLSAAPGRCRMQTRPRGGRSLLALCRRGEFDLHEQHEYPGPLKQRRQAYAIRAIRQLPTAA